MTLKITALITAFNESRQKEVLHQINPLIYISDGVEDPRGNWKDDHFGPLKGRCFNIARDSNIT